MKFYNSLSIQYRLVIAMLIAVVVSTSVVGIVGHSKAKDLLVSRFQQSDLPNLLQRVRNAVDGEISNMKVLTKTIATNPFLQDWLANNGSELNDKNVVKMLHKIAQDNDLSNTLLPIEKRLNIGIRTGFLEY